MRWMHNLKINQFQYGKLKTILNMHYECHDYFGAGLLVNYFRFRYCLFPFWCYIILHVVSNLIRFTCSSINHRSEQIILFWPNSETIKSFLLIIEIRKETTLIIPIWTYLRSCLTTDTVTCFKWMLFVYELCLLSKTFEIDLWLKMNDNNL